MKKVLSLVGARPQFVKEALVGRAAREGHSWEHVLVHSGQHYDAALSGVFFDELGIPEPRYHLGIGSGSHAAMTAAALTGMERLLLAEKPDALLVYGDTNTTLAGALAAVKLHVPVVHVEAGIRMQPKNMPEEINRVLTDHMASVFCCCSQYEVECLRDEGIVNNVAVTGDVMYDLYLCMQPRFTPEIACTKYGVSPGNFIVVTLHRDYNVDNRDVLLGIIAELEHLARSFPVLFFLHPRTHKMIKKFALEASFSQVVCAHPEGYLGLMSLVQQAAFVITDSGGLQKEAYYAGKRSIVVMPDTGWRALTQCGWNILAGDGTAGIVTAAERILHESGMVCPCGVYGRGDAAQRIISEVKFFLG